MNTIGIDPLVQHTVLFGFALVYGCSAIHKIRHYVIFRGTLENYRLIPAGLSSAATIMLIAAELITALLLLTPMYLAGVAVGLSLQVAYCLAISVNLARGRVHIDCGCMGADGEGISIFHAVRNVLLAVLLASAALPPVIREMGILDGTIMVFALLCSVVAWAVINKMLSNYSQQASWR